MAIINCPSCGKKVSNRATTCTHCGEQVSDSNGPPRGHRRSKKHSNLRNQQLIAACVFIIGALWIISVHLEPGRNYPRLALILAGLGGAWYVITRVRMWWEHWNEQ